MSPSNTASSDGPVKDGPVEDSPVKDGPVKGSVMDSKSDDGDQTKPHDFNGKLDEPQTATQPVVPLTKDDGKSSWSERDQEEAFPPEAATRAYAPVATSPGYGALGSPSGGGPTYAGAGGYTPSGGYPAGGYVSQGPPAQASPPPTVAPISRSSAAARRARLKVSHMGPLSVLRVSLTFSLCMFIVLLVAIAALWGVLNSSGVFKSIIDAATTLTNDKNQTGIAPWLSFGRVMLITVVLGAANVIAFTLLSTIGALLYNLCSDFVGGVEVTLIER